MTVKLEDGSEVSIQQYIEEQGSLVKEGLQGRYLQGPQGSYLQRLEQGGHLQGHGA